MIGIVAAISLVATAAIILWRCGNRASKVLKECGIPVVPGAMPFIGHIHQILKVEHFGVFDYNNMKKFGSVYGICEFGHPVLVITDAELLKEVLLNKFSCFTDRRRLPLRSWMKLSMFDQKGAEWKRIRAMLTPFFSVAKLKNNFFIMQKPVKHFLENLQYIYETGNMFEAHSICSSLSLDAICATAFGLDVDSQNDPNNQLLITLKMLSNVSLSSPSIFLACTFPFLASLFEFFHVTMFPSSYLEFFEKTAKQIIDERKKSDLTQSDFVQAMVKAHLQDIDYHTKIAMYGEGKTDLDTTKRGLTDKEIIAQVLLFFLGGYGTTSRTFAMFMYDMALHPEIQNKLYNEIVHQIGDEVPNYDSIHKLEYLDMCLNESLRLYPTAFRFDREATEDVTVGGIKIPKGTLVVVPIWAIQHDPDVWPSPETFDPERFSSEAKSTRDPMSFLPFGTGLRNCIGSRFALMELKLAVVQMLKSFKVVPNDRTPIHLELQNALFIEPKEKLWLSVEPRKRN